ncbi:MAG: hypothetical protein JST54_07450 [Deltaproteobacteria bacterium]|nr:hypothetical protein [Deltaproteobacteria bacterium]
MKTTLRVVAVAGALALFGCEDKTGPSSEKLKQSDAYRTAAQAVSLNQDVLEAVGEPVTFGDVALKRDSDDAITLDLSLSGPKGSGHAQMDVSKPTPKQALYMSRGGDFFPDKAGRPIHLRPTAPR